MVWWWPVQKAETSNNCKLLMVLLHDGLFNEYIHKCVSANKTSTQTSKRSGSYSKFQSCHDRMDIGDIWEAWGSESSSPVRGQTQNEKMNVFLPHLEGWSSWYFNAVGFWLQQIPIRIHQALLSCPSCVPEKVGINKKWYAYKIKRLKCKETNRRALNWHREGIN